LGHTASMRELHRAPATAQDLRDVPDGWTGQIVDGELWALPRPSFGHGRASTQLGFELVGPFGRGRGGPGGWLLLDEPELHLGADIIGPDLAGWRRERLPVDPPADAAFFTLAPDWVCEVLSPSTMRLDRVQKRRLYLRERVSWLWYLDPLGRTLEAYALGGEEYVASGTWGAGEKARVAPFEALELELDGLWGVDAAT
jgi:Uma2 family endonuclease